MIQFGKHRPEKLTQISFSSLRWADDANEFAIKSILGCDRQVISGQCSESVDETLMPE
jgi:hypothetical protein